MNGLMTVGQTINPYDESIKIAEQYDFNAEYLQAAKSYSKAFSSNKDLGRIDHRYNAARCWALAGQPDSAFHNLEKIAANGHYTKYYIITHDDSFNSLHNYKQWETIVAIIKSNKEKSEPNLNEHLAAQLDTIYADDQTYRKKSDEIEQKYGFRSKQMELQWRAIAQKDSANVRKVKNILDTYGWAGKDVIGAQGSLTLFLVIQHADQATQEKYLPLMREAVKNKKAQASSLALLEDRLALRQGKKQIYGSQISQNPKTGVYYVRPLEDPANVDKRRAEVQLPPLSQYVKQWGIEWSLEQYEKDLIKNNQQGKP
jgi:hypothetical protein